MAIIHATTHYSMLSARMELQGFLVESLHLHLINLSNVPGAGSSLSLLVVGTCHLLSSSTGLGQVLLKCFSV